MGLVRNDYCSDCAFTKILYPSALIHCKDCRHWDDFNKDGIGCCVDGIPISGDDMSYVETRYDDFCSYAEGRGKITR